MPIKIEINGKTVELSDETLEALEAIAARNSISLGEAIAQAITNEKFIEDEIAGGAKLLIEKDDSVRHLVFEPA